MDSGIVGFVLMYVKVILIRVNRMVYSIIYSILHTTIILYYPLYYISSWPIITSLYNNYAPNYDLEVEIVLQFTYFGGGQVINYKSNNKPSRRDSY